MQQGESLRKAETTDHLFQAVSKLMKIGGMTKKEAIGQVCRLIPVVTECFDDKVDLECGQHPRHDLP